MASSFLYPVALDLRGKKCVVVGGGTVGTRKAAALAEAGATVQILAMETTGPFQPEQLAGAFLVVAATNDPTVNAAVAEAARAYGALLNLAAPTDQPELHGDFATMATVRRGDLILAVTTGGAGPAATARLADELSQRYGSEWELYVSLLAELRDEAQRLLSNPTERTEALRRLAASDHIRALIRAGDYKAARREARTCVFGHTPEQEG